MTEMSGRQSLLLRSAVGGGVLAAVLIGAAPTVLAAAAPTVHCGSEISANATLASDLSCSPGQGVTLGSGVSLDLGGHRIVGSRTNSGPAVTFSPDGTSRVTNGTIQRWSDAFANDTAVIQNLNFVDAPVTSAAVSITASQFLRADFQSVPNFDSPAPVLISGSQFTDSSVGNFYDSAVSISNSQFKSSVLSGFMARFTLTGLKFAAGSITDGGSGFIKLDRSILTGTPVASEGDCSGINVTRSTIQNVHKGAAIYGCVGTLKGNKFIGNAVAVSTVLGLGATELDPGSQITGNVFTKNRIAITTSAAVDVVGNIFAGNGSGFIGDQVDASGDVFTRNLRDNVFVGNSASGVKVSGSTSRTTVAHNLATHNGKYGIYAPGAIDGGGNVAFANRAGQCVGIKCMTR